MKIVLQRVKNASVSVDGKTIGEIGKGYLALLGVSNTDTKEIAEKIAEKISKLVFLKTKTVKQTFRHPMCMAKYLLFLNLHSMPIAKKVIVPALQTPAVPTLLMNFMNILSKYVNQNSKKLLMASLVQICKFRL